MNTIDFCYWLQGHFELSGSDKLTEEQVRVIKNHLNLVFLHEIDPLRESQTTAKSEELQQVHDNNTKSATGLMPNDTLVRC